MPLPATIFGYTRAAEGERLADTLALKLNQNITSPHPKSGAGMAIEKTEKKA